MAGIHATQESQGKRAVTDNLHTLFTKLTAFALVLVVCVSVAACGDSPEEVATSDKKPKLANAEQVYGRSAMRLMSSIAQGDEAAKERVRAFLEKRAGKVEKQS